MRSLNARWGEGTDAREDGSVGLGATQKSYARGRSTGAKAGRGSEEQLVDSYRWQATRQAAGGEPRPLVGVTAPVSRERRLGGPLSPRAGRVAKEMTTRSAAPCRAAPAGRGLERRRFRFRSLSAPVPLPPPRWPRAFHRHLVSAVQPGPLLPRARPRGSGSGTGRAPVACP